MQSKKEMYELLYEQVEALTEGKQHLVSQLANTAAAIYQTLPDLNWAGFYLRDRETLYLGPFQGKTACIHIPLGKGVCGTAALKKETVMVEDVHQFPGHIACDQNSNSEIVIPMYRNNEVYAVLDLDSPVFGRFDREDKEGLERIASLLSGLEDSK